MIIGILVVVFFYSYIGEILVKKCYVVFLIEIVEELLIYLKIFSEIDEYV